MPGGINACIRARAVFMLSTVSITLAPGCLNTSNMTAVCSRCSAPSVTSWGPITIINDHLIVGFRLGELVVGGDCEALLRTEQRALGGLGGCVGKCRAYVG